MSQAAWRTRSGKPIRPAVIRGIAQQIERYDRALRLVETTESMVETDAQPEKAPQQQQGTPTVSSRVVVKDKPKR